MNIKNLIRYLVCFSVLSMNACSESGGGDESGAGSTISASVQACMDDYTGAYNFVPGSITVVFVDGTTEEEGRTIIEENGLSVEDYLSYLSSWEVTVPEGDEIEWVCRFEEDGSVDWASVNPMHYIY